jgi:hypothetical protein
MLILPITVITATEDLITITIITIAQLQLTEAIITITTATVVHQEATLLAHLAQ